jgi:hypothetical protein
MKLAKHFSILVYPFEHALNSRDRDANLPVFEKIRGASGINKQRLQAIDRVWKFWWHRLDSNETAWVFDNTYFFLPYIRSLLFPETNKYPAGYDQLEPGDIRNWQEMLASQSFEEVVEYGVVHLTYQQDMLKQISPFHLCFQYRDKDGQVKDSFEAIFDLHWIDLFLFPHSIGFLAMKIELSEDQPNMDRLMDALYFLRLVHPPAKDWQMAVWKFSGRGDSLDLFPEDWINYLLQGVAYSPAGNGKLFNLEEFPLTDMSKISNSYTRTSFGHVYGDVFRVYTYGCLSQFTESETSTFDKELFTSPFQKALYELTTYSDTNDPNYKPDSLYLSKLIKDSSMVYWHNWQGMALNDRITFLGKYPSNFTLEILPRNIEGDYFYLYLFTLYQETYLSLLFGKLMYDEHKLRDNLRRVRNLWETFLKFQNHFWFTEVTRKPQGTAIYQSFQRGLGVTPLYDQLKEEVSELQEFYETKYQRRISYMLDFLAFFALPLAILAEFFGDALIPEATWMDFLSTTFLIYAIIFVLWLLWQRSRND